MNSRHAQPILPLAFSLALSVCLASANPRVQSQQSPTEGNHDASRESPDETQHYWASPELAGQGYLSLAYIEQTGADNHNDLTGIRLSWGAWGEDPYRLGFSRPFPNALGVHFWLSETRNVVQDLWTAGLGAELSFLALGPFRLFPRFAVGFAYRTNNPDQGLGALAAFGLGTAVWLGRGWQVALAADREFYFPGVDSTKYMLEVRWLSGRLGFPIAE